MQVLGEQDVGIMNGSLGSYVAQGLSYMGLKGAMH